MDRDAAVQVIDLTTNLVREVIQSQTAPNLAPALPLALRSLESAADADEDEVLKLAADACPLLRVCLAKIFFAEGSQQKNQFLKAIAAYCGSAPETFAVLEQIVGMIVVVPSKTPGVEHVRMT